MKWLLLVSCFSFAALADTSHGYLVQKEGATVYEGISEDLRIIRVNSSLFSNEDLEVAKDCSSDESENAQAIQVETRTAVHEHTEPTGETVTITRAVVHSVKCIRAAGFREQWTSLMEALVAKEKNSKFEFATRSRGYLAGDEEDIFFGGLTEVMSRVKIESKDLSRAQKDALWKCFTMRETHAALVEAVLEKLPARSDLSGGRRYVEYVNVTSVECVEAPGFRERWKERWQSK